MTEPDSPQILRVDLPMTEAAARAIAEVASAERGYPVEVEYRTVEGQTAHVTAHEPPATGL